MANSYLSPIFGINPPNDVRENRFYECQTPTPYYKRC